MAAHTSRCCVPRSVEALSVRSSTVPPSPWPVLKRYNTRPCLATIWRESTPYTYFTVLKALFPPGHCRIVWMANTVDTGFVRLWPQLSCLHPMQCECDESAHISDVEVRSNINRYRGHDSRRKSTRFLDRITYTAQWWSWLLDKRFVLCPDISCPADRTRESPSHPTQWMLASCHA
jgi:hypothetical protein